MAGCNLQAERPGRYRFGKGRFLLDTAGLPEMDGVAADHPGSLELEPGQELAPGRREEGRTEIAAVAVVVLAEGHQAECCMLQRGARNGGSLF